MPQRAPVLLLVLFVVLSGATLGGAAQQYSIAASDSTDTEQRTVTIEGNDYQVDSVGTVPVGGSLSVEVDAPNDAPVQVNLYNSDRDIVDFKERTGSGSVTFDMNNYDPGSYVLVLNDEDNGTNEAIQPLVVAGWDASLSAATNSENEIERGEPLSVTVTIEEHTAMPSPESVEVVFTQDDDVVSRTDAEKVGSGEYEATLDTDRETGSYRVYANIRNTTMVEDRHEVVGVTDSHSITIVEGTTTTETSDSTEQSGSDGQGQSEPQPTTTTAEPTTATPTTTTATPTATTDRVTATETATSESTTTDSSMTSAATPTDSGLITAASDTSSADTTASSTPGFGVLAAVLGLLGFVVLHRAR